jgi:hypothetical protein
VPPRLGRVGAKLFLNGENIREFAIEPLGPQGHLACDLDQLCVDSRPAVTTSSDGKIWFLNGSTVSFIDPSRMAINTLPPPVHIEQVVADGQTFDDTRPLRLPPKPRNLSINYIALSLVAPERVHFRYMLEGQDSEWTEVVNKREVQYSNLLPGDYRFRVAASNTVGCGTTRAMCSTSRSPRRTTRRTGFARSARCCFWRCYGRSTSCVYGNCTISST